jgi:hypothetical protein
VLRQRKLDRRLPFQPTWPAIRAGRERRPTIRICVNAYGATSTINAWSVNNRADIVALNALGNLHGANREWTVDKGGYNINFPLVPAAFVTLHGQTVFITNRTFGRIGMVASGSGGNLPFVHRIVYPLEIGRDLTGCIAVAHHGRMFVAGNNSYPTKLRWSWVGEPCPEPTFTDTDNNWPGTFSRAWPTTNFLMVDCDGSTNDPISGLVSFGNSLWVMTTDGVYQISGSDWDEGADIVIQRVPGAPGCVSPRTVYANESGIFYMSKTGPWRVDRSRPRHLRVNRDFDGVALGNAHALTRSATSSHCPPLGSLLSTPSTTTTRRSAFPTGSYNELIANLPSKISFFGVERTSTRSRASSTCSCAWSWATHPAAPPASVRARFAPTTRCHRSRGCSRCRSRPR